MAKIEKISFPFMGDATDLIVDILSHDVEAGQCALDVKLTDGPRPMTKTETQPKVLYKTLIILTPQEYVNWGSDNSYLMNLVLKRLNLELLN